MQAKQHDTITFTKGPHAGKTTRIIATHTYPEAGQHASIRLPGQDVQWLPTDDMRPATPEEARTVEAHA